MKGERRPGVSSGGRETVVGSRAGVDPLDAVCSERTILASNAATFAPSAYAVASQLEGGLDGKEQNPNIPETPEEQAEAVYAAYKAGAAAHPCKGWNRGKRVRRSRRVLSPLRIGLIGPIRPIL